MPRIIGFDPGLRNTGWGVIDSTGNRLSYVAHGVVQPPAKEELGCRLSYLFEHLTIAIDTYAPDMAAVEETFISKHMTSTLKLGMARGVVLLAPAHKKIPIGEYGANKIKKTIVGAGHADKNQMIIMVGHLLPKATNLTADAADALAVAICHAHHLTLHSQMRT